MSNANVDQDGGGGDRRVRHETMSREFNVKGTEMGFGDTSVLDVTDSPGYELQNRFSRGAPVDTAAGDEAEAHVSLSTIMAVIVSTTPLVPESGGDETAFATWTNAGVPTTVVHGPFVCACDLLRTLAAHGYPATDRPATWRHEQHYLDSWRLVGSIGRGLLHCWRAERHFWSKMGSPVGPAPDTHRRRKDIGILPPKRLTGADLGRRLWGQLRKPLPPSQLGAPSSASALESSSSAIQASPSCCPTSTGESVLVRR